LRFHDLAWPDQYKVYRVIAGYFFHSERGSATLREAIGRAECVKAVQQVARHLGLPEGQMPGVETYERVRNELGLEVSASVIRRRWGSWHDVMKAASGQKVQMNARQRATFRAAVRRRLKGEDWLEGVREWLRERGPSLAQDDYDAWVRERNEKNPQLPPVAGGDGVRYGLVLPWSVVLEVAKGELKLADAQKRELKRQEAEDGDFIGLHAVALIHGMSAGRAKHMTAEDEGFPAYAFKLQRKRVWLLDDIQAHRSAQPFPRRTPGWLQCEILDSTDIKRLCGGLAKGELENALQRHCGSHVPRPAGHIGGSLYWYRIAVEAWLEGART